MLLQAHTWMLLTQPLNNRYRVIARAIIYDNDFVRFRVRLQHARHHTFNRFGLVVGWDDKRKFHGYSILYHKFTKNTKFTGKSAFSILAAKS
jgi:hypothetical protein